MWITPEVKLIIIVSISGFIGTTVRVLHESQKKKVSKTRISYIYFCSIAIVFAIWYSPPFLGMDKAKVFFSIVGGILSVDVVELIITHGKEWIQKLMNKKIDRDGD